MSNPAIDNRIVATMRRPGAGFYVAAAALLSVVAFGLFAYATQLLEGLRTTGMGRPMYWGVYMANFVFFIGISHAGTLISAILRVVGAEWRRPITRCAEVITVFALIFGAMSVIIDLGRPDRVLNVLQNGRPQSPILWDVCCISVYLTGSLIYLYLPLIPDLAILRDKKGMLAPLYRLMSLGYRGTPKQRMILERAISVMAILIIPIAVSVHTVVSYIFATTLQPGWHSTIFGPYFVVGAIFSGLAGLLIAMAIIRKTLRLEWVMKDIHFNNLGLVLLTMCCLMNYFTFNIYLVEITGNEPNVMTPVMEKVSGEYAIPFWGMIIGGFILPTIILAFPKGRTVTGCVVASVLILVAMWLERYLIIVPTLMHPRMPWREGLYAPTWVEWGITAGCISAFAFLYMLFARFFPIVSMWEVHEGVQESIPHVTGRFASYMPVVRPQPAAKPAKPRPRVGQYLASASRWVVGAGAKAGCKARSKEIRALTREGNGARRD
ncbi:MAG: polysulfide reductase NrfD [Planctomycetes bacterium]|nr:polysulfide reductase NrfD [Planctomycetota bacterium]